MINKIRANWSENDLCVSLEYGFHVANFILINFKF